MNADAWKEYESDFNNLTDEEIEREVRYAENKLDAAQSWLEAVQSWKDAGRPRNVEKL